VLSDALHNKDAVKYEWQQLLKWDLLDLSGDFAMLWDDCEINKGVVRGYNEVTCAAFQMCALGPVWWHACASNLSMRLSTHTVVSCNSDMCVQIMLDHPYSPRLVEC